MKLLFAIVPLGLLSGAVYAWLPTTATQAPVQTGFNDVADPLIPPATWSQQDFTADNADTEPRISLTVFEESRFAHDPQAIFHAHGEETCASGCSLSRHPTDKLTLARYHDLLSACSAAPLDEDNLAFETLLYFGRQTQRFADTHGTKPLDQRESAQLRRELRRQHATVSIRVVDDQGGLRSWVENVRVPLDRRHVFAMEVNALPPLVTSGTVKRVGLEHLWTRL